jgi:(E)-4-hydroxy-3-methylbut-2-enyl-diphosphate synthase
MGGLLCDGIGDAIQIEAPAASESRNLAFSVLQAARVRITRTEFISCPSCGRTLFDLEQTTARIRARTDHLKGVKIAIMGCVVNGPGEMADADFGYVGWGEDKIALFVGKEMVAKDIPTAEADERLVELIRQHGRWVDP